MNKKIIIANWKMNKTIKDSLIFLDKIKKECDSLDNERLVLGITPSFLSLPLFKGMDLKNIIVGAQNVFYKEKGSYTGEVSVEMVKEIGVDFVLVNHSERKTYFNETIKDANEKLKLLEKENVKAVLCVNSKNIVLQIKKALKDLSEDYVSKLIIAYEPKKSIGTGQSEDVSKVVEAYKKVNETITSLYNKNISSYVGFIYGGSVDNKNINDYISKEEIDGVLVGSYSLDANNFLNLIKEVLNNEE